MAGFDGQAAKVRGQHDVVAVVQRVIGGHRLHLGYIKASTRDPLRVQRADQCRLVDDRSTAGVNKYRARFHQVELCDRNQSTRGCGEGDVQRDDIGSLEKLIQLKILLTCATF